MKNGKINRLIGGREAANGFYLQDDKRTEVFLPSALVPEGFKTGDKINVFVYKNMDEKFIATTKTPPLLLNEFAYLNAQSVDEDGAMMDWGMPDPLFVPSHEFMGRITEGKSYLVYLFEDEDSGILIASGKEDDFLHFDDIPYKPGMEVDMLLYRKTDLGMNVIVENKYKGLVFKSDIHKMIHPGEKMKGYVKTVRSDGKLDLLLEPMGYKNTADQFIQKVLETMTENEGFLPLTDKSHPHAIKTKLGMSKKAFKRAIGNLYREKKILLQEDGIRFPEDKTAK